MASDEASGIMLWPFQQTIEEEVSDARQQDCPIGTLLLKASCSSVKSKAGVIHSLWTSVALRDKASCLALGCELLNGSCRVFVQHRRKPTAGHLFRGGRGKRPKGAVQFETHSRLTHTVRGLGYREQILLK